MIFRCDFLVTDDFDAVMAIIDADMLKNDTEMLSEVNSVIENLPSAKDSTLDNITTIFAPKFTYQNEDY